MGHKGLNDMKCIWNLFTDGTDKPVTWLDHKPNYRFAIYNFGTVNNTSDDLVLDKETGLIWPRNAFLANRTYNWLDARTSSRELKFANRIGWRLPTVEELSSLVDTRNSRPALPSNHPFVNVQIGATALGYWTSTAFEDGSGAGWFVNLDSGAAGPGNNTILGHFWPVRGGSNA